MPWPSAVASVRRSSCRGYRVGSIHPVRHRYSSTASADWALPIGGRVSVSRFLGRGDTGQQAAAVIESIVFLLLENLARMQKAEPDLRRLRVSGGLAQLDGLCQRLADLSGLPLETPAAA